MYKFLGTHSFPRLNQEEIENMNRLIIGNEIEPVIKNSQETKFQDQTASQVNSTKHLKKN